MGSQIWITFGHAMLIVYAVCGVLIILNAWRSWVLRYESKEEYLRKNGRPIHGNSHTKPVVKRPVNIKPPNPTRIHAKRFASEMEQAQKEMIDVHKSNDPKTKMKTRNELS